MIARPSGRRLGRLALVCCAVLAACGERTSSQGGPPELLENSAASIDETAIRAALVGDDVVLSFPLTRSWRSRIQGTLRAELVDIVTDGEPVVATAEVGFVQSTTLALHELRLAGAAAGLQRADTAGRVIAWRVRLPVGDLYGRTSLYQSLGKLEVEVRGATELLAGGAAPWRVIVRHPDSRSPVAGAAVTGSLAPESGGDPVNLFSGITDDAGELLASVALPEGVSEGRLRVDVSHGGSQVWTLVQLHSVADARLYLAADKTIYKPGQSVELRALLLSGSSRLPLAGEEVTFEAQDAKGNKVWRRRLTTDGFGVVATRLPLDARVNEGVWKVRAQALGARHELSLPVEAYVLPKLKVVIFLARDYAKPGDLVEGAVTAQYLFGEPVAGGNVRLDLRTASGSYVDSVTGQTDAQGRMAFSMPAPAFLAHETLEEGGERLTVDAVVTDTAGQVEAAQRSLPMAAGSLVIRALFEAPAVVPGAENRAFVVVTDPAGRPLVADLTVTGAGLSASPYTTTTDAGGVAELSFVGQGDLALSVVAEDGAGRSHTRLFTHAAAGEQLLVVRSDKAVYRAGDVASVEVLAAPGVERVYLDVYQGALAVGTLALDVVDGRAQGSFEVAASHKGVVVFDALALLDSGVVARGARRVLFDPEDRLELEISTDAETYLPGGEAQVTLSARDATGAPRVAALGLTAVNEAVFALGGEPPPGLPAFVNADPRVFAAAVAGRSMLDLFNTPGAEQDRLARLLFAAGAAVQAPGLEYNSLREERPTVVLRVAESVRRDGEAVLERMQILYDDGLVDEDGLDAAVVARAALMTDAFGQRYTASVQAGHVLRLTSAGPDEGAATADDVSQELSFQYILWGGGWWEEGDFAPAAGAIDEAADADAGAEPPMSPEGATTRVRSDFRETVYANPLLITDATGKATVSFPLADSITTWRLSAEGSTADGKLGAARAEVRTFQPFFVDFEMPARLTRGDELELAAVVYNYLAEPKTVTVELEPAAWLTTLDGTSRSLALGPSEVRSVKFRVRVETAGAQSLTLRGSADGLSDALVRSFDVLPDGEREVQTYSGKLNGTTQHLVDIPADAIAGGTQLELVVTPGFGGEVVQGVESLLREPGGCFEQTTASAWPNTLVTSYLEDTGQLTPELKEKSFEMVTRGYQRLLTFESPTGGYNWWGDSAPGNRILSAIMLWHTKDLERVIEVDPVVRDRTLAWLLAQQEADGSWAPGDALHAGNEVLGTSRVRSTAFIAWALAHTGWADDAVAAAVDYLEAHEAPADDLYANALVANALAMVAPDSAAAGGVFAVLEEMKQARDGGQASWPSGAPSWTGASGDAGALETTGLVAYALLKAQVEPESAAAAVRFIVANKDSVGTWYNTQATMNALRALSAAASPQGSEAEGLLHVWVNGVAVQTLPLTLADGDLVQRVDLTGYVAAGQNSVELEMVGAGEVSYRVTRQAFRPAAAPAAGELLELDVSYDTTTPVLGQPITATLLATNNDSGARDQVMVRLGRAPGFVPRAEDLTALVASGKVARYELRDAEVTFYLMGLEAGETRQLSLRLTPTLAVAAQAPRSSIYAYYEPMIRAEVPPEDFVVLTF